MVRIWIPEYHTWRLEQFPDPVNVTVDSELSIWLPTADITILGESQLDFFDLCKDECNDPLPF